MPADDTPDQAIMGKMIQAPLATIPLACPVYQSQCTREPFLKKLFLDPTGECFWMADPNEAADSNCVPVPNEIQCRFAGEKFIWHSNNAPNTSGASRKE